MTRLKIEAFLAEDLDLEPPNDPEPQSYTKASYVEAVLADKDLGRLADIAVQIDAYLECGAPYLLDVVSKIGPNGVAGDLKNLIFSADGPKPEIVLQDAVNNDLRVVQNGQYCLIYDRPLGPGGLTWRELGIWWAQRQSLIGLSEPQIWSNLYQRLCRSLSNEAEGRIFSTYAKRYTAYGPDIPALIPQVYLHYDPYTRKQHGIAPSPLIHQRMDFLLLLPNRARVVIECDGIQHYADEEGRADSRRYAALATEDRELRLRGYDVYRFGGSDLKDIAATEALLTDFFDRLAARYKV